MRRALLLLTSAYAEADANTFLDRYDAADSETRRVLVLTVGAYEKGMAWTNNLLENQRKEQPLYCTPPTLFLTGEQLVDII
jgi:hypothetical protein